MSRHNRERRQHRSEPGGRPPRPFFSQAPAAALTPTPAAPGVYAEAVHRAVCEFSGNDGFGKCYLYTIAGYTLLVNHPPGRSRFLPQAGSLYLTPDPDDPSFRFALVAEGDGMGR